MAPVRSPAAGTVRPDTLPLLLLQFDAQGRLDAATPGAQAWFGLPDGALTGLGLADIAGELWRDVLHRHSASALAGQSTRFEHVFMAKGAARVAHGIVMPRYGEGGTINGVLICGHDLTPMPAATDLHASAALFESTFESSAAGMGVMDADGRWVRVNPAFCAIVGYSAADLLDMRFADITHPEDLVDDLQQTQRMLAGEIPAFSMDKRYLHKEGRIVHVHLTVVAVRDAAGKLLHTVSQVIDVSRHYAAEAALREREILFRAMSEASPFGVFVDDPQGRCVYVNPAYQAITGLTAEKALGTGWHAAIHPEDRATILASVGRRSMLRQGQVLDHRYQHADGRVVLAKVRVGIMRDGERLIGVVGVVEDVTAARRNEEEIRRLNADLEYRVAERTAALAQSMRDLEAFSYSVSHDLRTPLRALDGYSALVMEKTVLDDEARGFLAAIRGTSQRMAHLIEDLLALAHTGRAPLQRSRLDLAAMARSIMTELRLAHPHRDVVFVAPELLYAHGDPHLVRALLQNLLDNAFKFSRDRSPARIELGVIDENGDAVHFVSDNGAGFDPAYADKVFLPFQRLHGGGEFAGNGIGLASASRIVERHGGRIWTRAAPGAGATFLFTLASGNDAPA